MWDRTFLRGWCSELVQGGWYLVLIVGAPSISGAAPLVSFLLKRPPFIHSFINCEAIAKKKEKRHRSLWLLEKRQPGVHVAYGTASIYVVAAAPPRRFFYCAIRRKRGKLRLLCLVHCVPSRARLYLGS